MGKRLCSATPQPSLIVENAEILLAAAGHLRRLGSCSAAFARAQARAGS